MKQLGLLLLSTTLLSACQVYKSVGRKNFESNSSGKLKSQSAVQEICTLKKHENQVQLCLAGPSADDQKNN